jgi:hypothetical protein
MTQENPGLRTLILDVTYTRIVQGMAVSRPIQNPQPSGESTTGDWLLARDQPIRGPAWADLDLGPRLVRSQFLAEHFTPQDSVLFPA